MGGSRCCLSSFLLVAFLYVRAEALWNAFTWAPNVKSSLLASVGSRAVRGQCSLGHCIHVCISESKGRMASSLIPVWLPSPSSVTKSCWRVADTWTGALNSPGAKKKHWLLHRSPRNDSVALIRIVERLLWKDVDGHFPWGLIWEAGLLVVSSGSFSAPWSADFRYRREPFHVSPWSDAQLTF